jgi:hypothetical protein
MNMLRLLSVCVAAGLMQVAIRAGAAPATAPSTPPATGPAGSRPSRSVTFAEPDDARRVIFVCDASGSMIGKMTSLKAELAKAVEGLDAHQEFNLIFFQDQTALTLARDHLTPANREGKTEALRFLDDVTTSSTSDPVRALRKAFEQRPDLVYLVTDGDFPDNRLVRSEIWRLNRELGARVDTIAFVNERDTDTEFLPALKAIARENRGCFRDVSVNWLEDEWNPTPSKAILEEVAPPTHDSRNATTGPATRRPSTRRSPGPELPNFSRAAEVVFVCDASAAMADRLPELKRVLANAINGLHAGQAFNVMFLHADRPSSLAEGGLLPANDRRKAQALQFVQEEVAEGDPGAERAIEAALDLKPAVIILLGDEWFGGISEYVTELNKDVHAKIDAISFVRADDPTLADGHASVLRLVAQRNAGSFRRILVETSRP